MSDERVDTGAGTTRRRALVAGAGAIGATAVLAACGTDATGRDPYSFGDAETAGPEPSATPSATGSPSQEPARKGDNGDGGGQTAEALAAVNEVEVGGGLVIGEQDVVITQPAQGDWRGFAATCTHQGCTVASVADGTINCGCHGSQFSIDDGSVVNGPAAQPLAERAIAVEGDQIVLA